MNIAETCLEIQIGIKWNPFGSSDKSLLNIYRHGYGQPYFKVKPFFSNIVSKLLL